MADPIRQIGLLRDINNWFSKTIKDINDDNFGMYTNPDDDNEFQNFPYPDQRREIEKYLFIYSMIGGTDFVGEYFKICKKKSSLSKSQRDYVIKTIEEYDN